MSCDSPGGHANAHQAKVQPSDRCTKVENDIRHAEPTSLRHLLGYCRPRRLCFGWRPQVCLEIVTTGSEITMQDTPHYVVVGRRATGKAGYISHLELGCYSMVVTDLTMDLWNSIDPKPRYVVFMCRGFVGFRDALEALLEAVGVPLVEIPHVTDLIQNEPLFNYVEIDRLRSRYDLGRI